MPTSTGREHAVELVLCPPWLTECPPLSLAYLSAFLRAHGVDTRIRDLNAELRRRIEPEFRHFWEVTTANFWHRPSILSGVFSPAVTTFLDGYARELAESPAPVLGFSCQGANVMFTLELISLLRRRGCRKLFVVGGASVRLDRPGDPASVGLTGFRPAEFDDRACLRELREHLDRIDVLVEGEGEQTLLDVASAWFDGRLLTGIPGAVAWRHGGREAAFTAREAEKNLDLIPSPSFDEFDLSIYDKPFLPFLTSRGCIRKCSMCYERLLWPGFRHRSAGHIVAEMRTHFERHGISMFSCNDLLLNGNLPHLGRVCDAIAEAGLPVRWWGNAVVHRLMDRPLFARMRRGGIHALVYGIESGSQRVLNRMRKGFRIEDADLVLRMGSEAGLMNVINLIVGFPGETAEDHALTLDFVRRNHEHIAEVAVLAMCKIYPGSPLAEQAEYYGVEPQSLLQLDPYDANTTWRDTRGLDDEVRKARFIELYRLIRSLDVPVFGVEDEEAELSGAELTAVLEKLREPTAWAREEAAHRIRFCRKPEIVPDLVRSLADSSSVVTGLCLRTLGEIEPARAWDEAARLIGRRSPYVDHAAMICLAARDCPESYEFFEAQLASDTYERAEVQLRRALAPFRQTYRVFEEFAAAAERASSGTPGVTGTAGKPSARAALTHRSVWLRRRTLRFLMSQPALARSLREELLALDLTRDDDPQVRGLALELWATALRPVPVRLVEEAWLAADPEARSMAARMAGLLHFEPDGADHPARDTAAVMAEAGSPLLEAAAADWRRACLGDWEAWLREPHRDGEPEGYRAWLLARAVVVSPEPGWFRSFVQWALVQGDGPVREWLLAELLRAGRLDLGETVLGCLAHPTSAVRRLACQYLGAAASRLAENPLVERLSDPELPIVFRAAEALGRMRSPQTVRHLGAWLSDPAFGALPPYLREALAPCREARNRVLLPESADALAPELLEEFASLDPLGRVCLLESIRQTQAPMRFRALLERALSDPDECVWLHALEMVARSEDGAFAPKILPALMDSRASIRGLVCRYLALTRCQLAKTAFRKLMQDDPEPMVREWAARGLGRLRDPATLASLMPLVQSGVFETLEPEMQRDLSYFRKLALTAAERRP